jgi:hypothetical protein
MWLTAASGETYRFDPTRTGAAHMTDARIEHLDADGLTEAMAVVPLDA